MNNRMKGLTIVLMVSVLALASCKGHRRDADIRLPDSFTSTGENPMPDKWWQEFGDPVLNEIVEQAMSGNLDVKSAWTRLDQARASMKASRAALFPSLSLGFKVSDTEYYGEEETPDTTSLFGGGGGGGLPTGGASSLASIQEGTFYTPSATASYEVDLWGRYLSSKRAADANMEASEHDLFSMAMTMSAEVSRAWYTLVEKRRRMEILEEQEQVNENYLKLIEFRYNRGLVSAADVLQQRQQLSATQGEMSLVRMQIETFEHQLNLLLGREPTATVNDGGTLAQLPPLPETGVPAELLLRRPDVKSAQKRLEAADHRVAVAIADMFPTLSITLSAQDTEEEFESLFDNWIRNIAINLVAPIFDAGRRKAEVERTKAASHEALYNFEKTVLTAAREVEDALTKERHQREYMERLSDQLVSARDALELSRQRYLNGSADYLRVLVNLQSVQSLEKRELEAERTLISYRIDLYRALGGGFELHREEPEEETINPEKENKGGQK